MAKTWIDLTDMFTWKGNFTGIQRVVYEISLRYEKTACFFFYDEETNSFREASFKELKDRVQAHSKTHKAQSISKRGKALSIIGAIIPNRIKRLLPPKYRRVMLFSARKIADNAARALHQVRAIKKYAFSRVEGNSSHALLEVQFSKEDKVIVLGAGWHKTGFIYKLRELKNQECFSVVHVIYDLIPVYFPHFFGPGLYEHYTKYLFEAIVLSNQLIAISESTRNDTIRFCEQLGINTPPIDIIRLGEDIVINPKSSSDRLESEEYILCVGTVEVRKNHSLIHQAYRYQKQKGVELPKMIIVGRPGWLVDDLLYALEHDPVVKDKIEIKTHVDDENLARLYSNALFTVYPSFYEGWGLPIAESLAYGKLCLSSETSSMTEIAGSNIEYFSPYNAIEFSELIRKYYENRELLKAKEKQIRTSYKHTTWDQCALRFKSIVKAHQP